MDGIFKLRGNTRYHLRYISQFFADPIHSVINDSESASYAEPKFGNKSLPKLKTLMTGD